MICEHCLNNETTVHITKKADGVTRSVALCPQCAEKLGFQSPLDDMPFPLAQLLDRLFSDPSASENSLDPSALTPEEQDHDFNEMVPDLRCPACQLTYKEFVRTGRFGCGQCYREFRERVENIMLKVHGASKHVGQTPLIAYDKPAAIQEEEQLRQKLQEAIEAEEYERAAELRDRIEALEAEQSASQESEEHSEEFAG